MQRQDLQSGEDRHPSTYSDKEGGGDPLGRFAFALTGVILQVLGLHVALLNVLLGAAGLVVKLVSKDLPRSSDKDDPGHST